VESKPVIVGIIIGVIVGGFVGFLVKTSPDVSDLQSKMDVFKAEASAYTSALSELNNDYDQLLDDYKSLQSELDVTEKKLQDGIVNYESLQLELDDREMRVQELESTVEGLEDTVERLQLAFNYTPGTWSVLKTWNGSADRTTELFHAPSNQTKITWRLELGQHSYFSIRIRSEKGVYVDSWLSLEEQPKGETYAYMDAGNYYLEFSVVNCSYTVTVESVTT